VSEEGRGSPIARTGFTADELKVLRLISQKPAPVEYADDPVVALLIRFKLLTGRDDCIEITESGRLVLATTPLD
jgi:hypothetical protein